jgi:glutamate dehydrogenase
VERASRWLGTHRRPPLDLAETVSYFSEPLRVAQTELAELLTGRELSAYTGRRDRLTVDGVPEELASRIAALSPSYSLLGVVDTALREKLDPATVGRVHFALGERLGLSTLNQRIITLPRKDRWQTMARAALRDDLHGVHTQLTAEVLRTTDDDDAAPVRVHTWEDAKDVLVARAAETLEQICADDSVDLARMSVGLRAHTFGGTSLDEKTVELINVAISDLAACRPCTSGHVTKARQLGLSDEAILEAVQCTATMMAGVQFLKAAEVQAGQSET